MRQEVFCRNNGGLEKLIARGAFHGFPLPHYHLSRVKLLLNASAFLLCSSSVFAAFSDLNSRNRRAKDIAETSARPEPSAHTIK